MGLLESLGLITATALVLAVAGMLVWIGFEVLRASRRWLMRRLNTGEPMQQIPFAEAPRAPVLPAEPIMDENELREWFMEHKCCPDCGGTSFIGGPRGGYAQNILCAGCHSEYNMALPLAVERIGAPRCGRVGSIYRVDEPEPVDEDGPTPTPPTRRLNLLMGEDPCEP